MKLTEKEDRLLKLLHLYVNTVISYSATLSKHLSLNDLIHWRSRNVPIKGNFEGGLWNYAFHGSGCYLSSPEFKIDFEFGEAGKLGGFDAWRIKSFIEENDQVASIQSPGLCDENELEEQLSQMLASGFLTRPMGDGLYYLVKGEGNSL